MVDLHALLSILNVLAFFYLPVYKTTYSAVPSPTPYIFICICLLIFAVNAFVLRCHHFCVRMEEKLSNAESESQVLRQKSLEMTQRLSSAEAEMQEMTQKLSKAESEIRSLRQQALTMTPAPKSAPVRSKTMVQVVTNLVEKLLC